MPCGQCQKKKLIGLPIAFSHPSIRIDVGRPTFNIIRNGWVCPRPEPHLIVCQCPLKCKPLCPCISVGVKICSGNELAIHLQQDWIQGHNLWSERTWLSILDWSWPSNHNRMIPQHCGTHRFVQRKLFGIQQNLPCLFSYIWHCTSYENQQQLGN